MVTINSFEEWFNLFDLSDYEDIDSMYRSVDECSSYGQFKTQIARGENNGWILSCDDGDCALHIKTEKAMREFLRQIELRYCNGEPENIWYEFHRAMSKND